MNRIVLDATPFPAQFPCPGYNPTPGPRDLFQYAKYCRVNPATVMIAQMCGQYNPPTLAAFIDEGRVNNASRWWGLSPAQVDDGYGSVNPTGPGLTPDQPGFWSTFDALVSFCANSPQMYSATMGLLMPSTYKMAMVLDFESAPFQSNPYQQQLMDHANAHKNGAMVARWNPVIPGDLAQSDMAIFDLYAVLNVPSLPHNYLSMWRNMIAVAKRQVRQVNSVIPIWSGITPYYQLPSGAPVLIDGHLFREMLLVLRDEGFDAILPWIGYGTVAQCGLDNLFSIVDIWSR